MPTIINIFVDTDVSGGSADGSSLANAYSGIQTAVNTESGGSPNRVTSADLVANDEVANFICAATSGTQENFSSASFLIGTNWTADATRRVQITAASTDRASTEWDASNYTFFSNSSAVVGDMFRASVIDGIQIETARVGSQNGIQGIRSSDVEIINCHFRNSGSGTHNSIVWNTDAGAVFANNVFDLSGGTNTKTAIFNSRASATSDIYNNTFISCTLAVNYTSTATARMKNNLFDGNTTDVAGTMAAGTDNNATDNSSIGYTVTGGGNSNDRLSQTFTFVSGTDFAITGADAGARTFGVDLTSDATFPFNTDIDANVRGSVWDIGAFQVTPVVVSPVITSITDPAITGTALTITGTDFESVQGTGNVTQTIDGETVSLTETAWADTEITATSATIESTSLKYGVQTIEVTNDSGESGNNTYTSTPVVDNDFVDLTSVAVSGDRITAVSDLAAGDQLRYQDLLQQGGSPTAFTVVVNADATFSVDGLTTDGTYTFEVRARDDDDKTWGTAADQTVIIGAVASGGARQRLFIGIGIGI